MRQHHQARPGREDRAAVPIAWRGKSSGLTACLLDRDLQVTRAQLVVPSRIQGVRMHEHPPVTSLRPCLKPAPRSATPAATW